MIRYVDWISNETLEDVTWPAPLTKYIDTGIHFSSNTKIRYKCYYEGYINHTGAIGSINSIRPDFSVFWYPAPDNIYIDINGNGSNTTMPKNTGDFIDFTVVNRSIYDNVTESYILSGNPASSFENNVNTIWIDVQTARFQAIEIYENDVLVFDGHAAYDTTYGTIGVYDTISQGIFVNNNLNIIKGDFLSFVSADKTTVAASGGTINVTISSNSSWSATSSGNWYTMSATAGTSANTAMTITVPSTTATTQMEDTITFTNANGETSELTIKQRKYSAGGIRLLNIGTEAVDTLYIGSDAVQTIYFGTDTVYEVSSVTPTPIPDNLVVNAVGPNNDGEVEITASFSSSTYDDLFIASWLSDDEMWAIQEAEMNGEEFDADAWMRDNGRAAQCSGNTYSDTLYVPDAERNFHIVVSLYNSSTHEIDENNQWGTDVFWVPEQPEEPEPEPEPEPEEE